MFSDPLGGSPAPEPDDGFTWDLQSPPEPAPPPPGATTTTAPPGIEAPATPPAQPAEAPGAQPRDDRGRFTTPEQQPAVAGVAPVPPEGAAAPTAPAAPAPGVEGQAAAEAEALKDFPAWTIRADREDFEVPGSKYGTNGVWFPTETLPQLQELIAEGVANRGSARELREQLEAENESLRLRLQNDPELVRARAFNQGMMRLLAAGPDAVASWLEDFQNNRARLVAEAEQAVLRQQNEAYQAELNQLREAQEASRLEPVMTDALHNTVSELAGRPEFAGVDADLILDRLRTPRGLDAVFYEVDPAERPRGPNEDEFLLGHGAQGQMYLMNWGVIANEFMYQAQFRRGSTAPEAAAHNAAALAGRPVQGGTQPGAPPPAPATPAAPRFKNKQEMERWFDEQFSPQR